MARIASFKTRGFCFTLNNPREGDEKLLLDIASRYITFGREKGENGTPHLQGYIHFRSPRHFTSVKRLVPRWHVEPRNGTITQAINYCHKDGDFVEQGDRPTDNKDHARAAGNANKHRWITILKQARDGNSAWIAENEPRVYVQFMPRLESLRTVKTPNLEGDLLNEWWMGPTGSGKSKLLWELYPDHFSKRLSKWWCGYNREPVVAIEEWSPKNEVTGSQLKIWADRYAFNGEVKGGTLMHLRPKKFIILSNYSIDECFPDNSDREPIKRRFFVRRFPEEKPWAIQAHAYYLEKYPETTVVASQQSSPPAETPLDLDNWTESDLQAAIEFLG